LRPQRIAEIDEATQAQQQGLIQRVGLLLPHHGPVNFDEALDAMS